MAKPGGQGADIEGSPPSDDLIAKPVEERSCYEQNLLRLTRSLQRRRINGTMVAMIRKIGRALMRPERASRWEMIHGLTQREAGSIQVLLSQSVPIPPCLWAINGPQMRTARSEIYIDFVQPILRLLLLDSTCSRWPTKRSPRRIV